MASASTELIGSLTTEVKYCGPAGQEFASFQELAFYSMDNYYPNWRNYGHSDGYLIPSGLDRPRPEMSDDERLVIKAIQGLTEKEFPTSFIAICKLDIRKNADHLHHYFPSVPSKELSEMLESCPHNYDFILIGPKIGIIVIEVVSSSEKEEYKHAVEGLLKKSDNLFRLLEICTGVKLPVGLKPWKFIYAPKVKKLNLFERWTTSNDGKMTTMFRKRTNNMLDEDGKRSLLQRALGEAFEKAIKDTYTNKMIKYKATELYETYGPMISAFASITAFRSQGWNPSAYITKILFLTPDQQNVLNGPRRQLIVGASGSGQTIILQAKALQLLSQGQSVRVIGPKNLVSTSYKMLFDSRGFHNYKVMDWWDGEFQTFFSEIEAWCDEHGTKGLDTTVPVYEYLRRQNHTNNQQLEKLKTWLRGDDHILIDVAYILIDVRAKFQWIMVIFAVAAYIREADNKTIWITIDSNYFRPDDSLLKPLRSSNLEGDCYSIVLLKQVLRCSENIFTEAYKPQMWQSAYLVTGHIPVLDHRIKGLEVNKIFVDWASFDARQVLATRISEQLNRFTEKEFRLNDIGIIIDTHSHDSLIDYLINNVAVVNGKKVLSRTEDRDKCMVRYWSYWSSVSSVEWPLVIFVNDSPRVTTSYIEYISMAKATKALVIITAAVGEPTPNSSQEPLLTPPMMPMLQPPPTTPVTIANTMLPGTHTAPTNLEEHPVTSSFTEKGSVRTKNTQEISTIDNSICADVGKSSQIPSKEQSQENIQPLSKFNFEHLQDSKNSNEMKKEFAIIKAEDLIFGIQDRLARGSFGDVYKAKLQPNNLEVAVKVVQTSSNDKMSMIDEVELLKCLNHPHILSIIGVVDNAGQTWIVTEFLNAGSLRHYTTGESRFQLKEIQKLEIRVHCWSGLAYLHENKITHKDIAPQNIMLHRLTDDGRLIAKLCDFGLAKMKETFTGTHTTKFEGTAMYFPPEFTDLRRNPKKADVYSMGATLCELFTNLHFWHYENNKTPLDYNQVVFKLAKIYQNKSEETGRSKSDQGNQKRRIEAFGKLENNWGKQSEEANTRKSEHLVICASEFLDAPIPIRKALRKTISFDGEQRPSAGEVLKVFENTLVDPVADVSPIKSNFLETENPLLFALHEYRLSRQIDIRNEKAPLF